ncbi:cell division inhibitor SulA [Marinimicrobium alkaliphilum]|uniref:cell division inhibitor SulA n=1 Tax=Marinimicrobium alkaliphilum TaxID=2202654 RepID=UPI000DBAB656|nr:hypothetical protein [Marinimicrobium alkaliphilum]
MNNTIRLQAPPATRPSGLTQLVLGSDQQTNLALLLPMIAHLSWQDDSRWLTWIAPKGIDRGLLERFGVNSRCVRLIHPRRSDACRWIAWEALASGTSHTVVVAPEQLSERDLQALEGAAQTGEAQAIVLQTRPDHWR